MQDNGWRKQLAKEVSQQKANVVQLSVLMRLTFFFFFLEMSVTNTVITRLVMTFGEHTTSRLPVLSHLHVPLWIITQAL